jgi:cytolysin-activating lysine-acyltransferase
MNAPQPAAAVAPLSDAVVKQRAALSWRITAAFGSIVSVLMRSASHRALPLASIEELVVPAVLTQQFFLTQAQSKTNGLTAPVGVVLWASVSPAIDQRLTATPDQAPRLAMAEWKTGDIVWIVEAVGEPQIVNAMIKQLGQSAWKGRPVRLRLAGQDGKVAVHTLKTDAA